MTFAAFSLCKLLKTNVDMIYSRRTASDMNTPWTCRRHVHTPAFGPEWCIFLVRGVLAIWAYTYVRFAAVAVRTVTQVVRLKSSLTMETTHKRLYGALDKFNSQMTKPPLPAANGGGNLPHDEGLCLFSSTRQIFRQSNVKPLLKPTYRAGLVFARLGCEPRADIYRLSSSHRTPPWPTFT